MARLLLYLLPLILCAASCIKKGESGIPEGKTNPLELTSRPYTRYWWFASVITEEDVRYNLDWLKKNGFGEVEIAWVYPLNRFNPGDTTYTPRQEWLSSDWRDIVAYAVRYADSIGLGCDLTLGTLWPFGDSRVPFEQASRRFGDPGWRQVITRTWEHPLPGYVVDHLTPANYIPYFNRMLEAFPGYQSRIPGSGFIDSWEVETEYLWAEGMKEEFEKRFSYDITPLMDSIYQPGFEVYLYDYMCLISDKVLAFYEEFDYSLNMAGLFSRGQVSGAPCDLISGYAKLDIPEGESMLFEPEFCAIPASAALLSGKNVVTSETFTCLYGWPADYLRKEQTADLKLVADALFANGINHIIWHGKPHNPANQDTVSFYASTHTGPSAHFADELPLFNGYLEKISGYMKKGNKYSDIAVYLPTEDAWVKGVMPEEQQFIWAWGHYEMRYVYFPEELAGHNPSWINYEFLEKGKIKNGTLHVGNGKFRALYLNSEYVDYKTVKRIEQLAAEGLPIIMKQIPKEPGTLLHNDYNTLTDKILKSRHDISSIPEDIQPFVRGESLPRYWAREDKKTLYVFFPNPKSDMLKFPLEYGQSFQTETLARHIFLNYRGRQYELDLQFKPYQSLMYRIGNGRAEQIDIEFLPPEPLMQVRPDGYIAPWLVR